jgi:hypothetical protein
MGSLSTYLSQYLLRDHTSNFKHWTNFPDLDLMIVASVPEARPQVNVSQQQTMQYTWPRQRFWYLNVKVDYQPMPIYICEFLMDSEWPVNSPVRNYNCALFTSSVSTRDATGMVQPYNWHFRGPVWPTCWHKVEESRTVPARFHITLTGFTCFGWSLTVWENINVPILVPAICILHYTCLHGVYFSWTLWCMVPVRNVTPPCATTTHTSPYTFLVSKLSMYQGPH